MILKQWRVQIQITALPKFDVYVADSDEMIMVTFTMTKNENISQIHGRGNNTQLASNIPLLAITRPAPPSNILVMRIVILGSIITIL